MLFLRLPHWNYSVKNTETPFQLLRPLYYGIVYCSTLLYITVHYILTIILISLANSGMMKILIIDSIIITVVFMSFFKAEG